MPRIYLHWPNIFYIEFNIEFTIKIQAIENMCQNDARANENDEF